MINFKAKRLLAKISKTSFAATVAITMAATPALAAKCYNKNDQRDKWLAGWVYWIPAEGKKAEARGKSYTQRKAMKWALKDIPAGYKKRDSNVNGSPAGLAAIAMIEAKNDAKGAERRYLKAVKGKKNEDGSAIKVSFADASACWKRFK